MREHFRNAPDFSPPVFTLMKNKYNSQYIEEINSLKKDKELLEIVKAAFKDSRFDAIAGLT